jgi:hypothetical protein
VVADTVVPPAKDEDDVARALAAVLLWAGFLAAGFAATVLSAVVAMVAAAEVVAVVIVGFAGSATAAGA